MVAHATIKGGDVLISFMKYISRIARCADQYRNDCLVEDKLTGYQYTYIINICRNPGISQDKLSKIIYINKSNVTRQIRLLEQNGYVLRKGSIYDKRVIEVYPTEKANEVLPKIINVLHEWNDYLVSDFTDEEKKIMQQLLRRMMDKAENYIESEKHDNI